MTKLQATITDPDYRLVKGRLYRVYERGTVYGPGGRCLRVVVVRREKRQWVVPYRFFRPVPGRVRINQGK